MRGGWRYDVHVGRWVSDPVELGPIVAGPVGWVARYLLDTAEDVDLYAAELGVTRTQVHARVDRTRPGVG